MDRFFHIGRYTDKRIIPQKDYIPYNREYSLKILKGVGMLKRILVIIVLNLFLISCSSDNHEKLIGYWELTNEGRLYIPPIIQIVNNGENYLYRDAFSFEETGYEVVLKVDGGDLILDARNISNTPLVLIDNESVLLIGERRFIRSKEQRVQELRAEWRLNKQNEQQKAQDEINRLLNGS